MSRSTSIPAARFQRRGRGSCSGQLDQPTAAELAHVAAVFDQYRHHYGEPVVAGQALAWLTRDTRCGMLTIFTVHAGGGSGGIRHHRGRAGILATGLFLAASGSICRALGPALRRR